jgi:hypothetical protein
MPQASDDNIQEMTGPTNHYILYHVYILYTVLCIMYTIIL